MTGTPRPEAIIFDWDNTLVDSWPVIHDALNVTFAAFGLEPWTMPETKVRVRKSMRDSFPGLFGDRWRDAGEVFYERYSAIHMDKIVPLPGSEETLSGLAGEGLYMGVVSNKHGDYLREEAEALGWDRYFGRLVGAFDAPRDKPAPDPVEMALSGSGVGCGQTVWVAGDADIDLECARNADCVPVLVREQPPQDGEFSGFLPLHHFRSCLELCKFVKGL